MSTRNRAIVNSFVDSMEQAIRFFSDGKLGDSEIKYLAEREVNRLDFNNDWQMHKGLGYFAKIAVERIL